MKRIFASLTISSLFISVPTFAAGSFSINPEISVATTKISVKEVTTVNKTKGTQETYKAGSPRDQTSLGVGVSFSYPILDKLSINTGLSYRNYPKQKDQGDFDAAIVRAGASYDFLKQDQFSLFGGAGIEYMTLMTKPKTEDSVKSKAFQTQVTSYGLGLGGRYEVSDSMQIALEYRFSSTLAAPGYTYKYADIGTGEEFQAKVKGLKLESHEALASLLFAL